MRLRHRSALAAVALALPFLGVWWLAQTAGDRAALRAATALDVVAEAVPQQQPPEVLPPTQEAEAIAALDGELEQGEAVEEESKPTPLNQAGGATKQRVAPLPRAVGVLVREQRVMRAAKAGIRPSGSPVPATSFRPAGMALVGVSALGVGLRDGDVLTRAGGTMATSEAAVIGAATGALRSSAKAITGEVWRGRQRILLTVELPTLKQQAVVSSKTQPLAAHGADG